MTTRRATLKSLAASLALPILPGVAGCGAPPPRPATPVPGDGDGLYRELDAWIARRVKQDRLVGLSVALLDGPRLAWARGYGQADREAGRAAQASTRYRAGSITKLFTAAAVLQLVDQGRLDLDVPVERYLPEFTLAQGFPGAGAPEAITLRHLLTHHAGLPSDWSEGMWTHQPEHFGTLLDWLAGEGAAFPPGLVHAYSNVGYSLLGLVVERVGGLSYADYVGRHLLAPLGMDDSRIQAQPPAGPAGAAAYDEAGRPGRELPLRDTPAGGLNSTAPDLLSFARLILGGGQVDGRRLLSEAVVAEMVRPQNQDCPLDADLGVGLGWHFAPEVVPGAGPVLFHDGGTLHHRAVLLVLPECQMAAAVMTNSSQGLETALAVAGQALTRMRAARGGPPEGTAPASLRFPPAAAESFPGAYDTVLGFASVGGRASGLRLDLGGRFLALRPREAGYLGLEYRLLGLWRLDLGPLEEYRLTRARLADREVLLARHRGRFHLAGERLEPVPIPDAWRARLGDYRYVGRDPLLVQELEGASTRLLEKDGFLLVETRTRRDRLRLALEPLDDRVARVRGLGRGRGGWVRAVPDGGGDGEQLVHGGMFFRRAV